MFEGLVGTSARSDIAIDDLLFNDGHYCQESGTTVTGHHVMHYDNSRQSSRDAMRQQSLVIT